MDNKLSELSKPVQIFKHPAGRNFWAVSADSNAGQRDVEPFYSQEYVSALLADNEAKDKSIAELEAKTAMTMGVGDGGGSLFVHGDFDSIKTAQSIVFENESLRAKLATPVRLMGEMLLHDWEHSVERQAAFQHRKTAWDARLEEDKKAIRAAGFTFTVEGDE
ncbi:TPA: hypothetical protein ACGQSM_003696 [Serratia liquefaciens]